MTHYERAAKYVNKRLGVKFRTSHIESLEKQFKQVAEEAIQSIYLDLKPMSARQIEILINKCRRPSETI